MRSFPRFAIALFLVSFAPHAIWAQQAHCRPCQEGFGKVQVGSSADRSFQITNTGSRTLRIRAVTEQGAEFSLGAIVFPISVKPGASAQLPVVFTPTAAGYVTGSLAVKSNDPASPLTLHLAGTGISVNKSQLTVSPATLNFGNVTVGTSATLQATLQASGGEVTITSDQTNSSEFTITGLTLPVKLRAGQSVQATIQFTPNASGTASAQDEFVSSAANSPSSEQLSGTGVPASSHSAYLTWNIGDPSAVGYNVYRGTTHGGPYSQINSSLLPSTDYTDDTVVGGNTYYYVATEVTNQGQESGYSDEAKAIIPSN
jgi:hypothetical protein